MKVEQTSIVGYDEIDTAHFMKLPILFQWLQRSALKHSDRVGLTSERMVAHGGVWILSRMRVEIRRMPRFRETVTVRTWHKGSVGFRAGRDFVLLCGEEPVVAATSQWLYYNLERQRIAKIPRPVAEPYTTESSEALYPGAIDFAVDKSFTPRHTITITIRDGDIDPNGHVNNAVYLEYLNTLLGRTGAGTRRLRQVGIQYLKEIGRGVDAIQAGLIVADGSVRFRFFDDRTVFAAGFAGYGSPDETGPE